MNKLDEICATKRDHVRQQQANVSAAALRDDIEHQTPPRGFIAAIREKSADGFALIAEIKKASPSKGLIREDFRPSRPRPRLSGGWSRLSVGSDRPALFSGRR